MAYDLGDFSLVDMLQCGRGIRRVAAKAATMEEAARSVVDYLYRECRTTSSASESCALIRFYKTRPYKDLDELRQAFVRRLMGRAKVWDDMKCLTLLATIGQEPEWCDPHQSVSHQAMPLPSVKMVEQAPMISQLIKEMGLDIGEVLRPDPSFLHQLAGKTYNVFHVPDAHGSPYIPAQADFVERYGVRSVLGFGGLMGDGEFFAVIMFAHGSIPGESALRFRHIALDVKAAIHPFARSSIPVLDALGA